jgi:hypothetical protein
MESTSKRSSQAGTIASVVVVPSLVQTMASGLSKGVPEGENSLNREGCRESKLATAEERRGEIDSYLRDIRHRIDACIENNRAYYEVAERNWEACQSHHRRSQRRLDRLEQLARQATTQQIQLTHIYQQRKAENSMYHIV